MTIPPPPSGDQSNPQPEDTAQPAADRYRAAEPHPEGGYQAGSDPQFTAPQQHGSDDAWKPSGTPYQDNAGVGDAGTNGIGQAGYGQAQYSQPGYGQPGHNQQEAYGQPIPAYSNNSALNNGYIPGLDPRSGQYTYGQPGIIPLRPLNFGDLLSGSLAMVRYAPMKLLLATCIVMLPFLLVGGVIFGLAVVNQTPGVELGEIASPAIPPLYLQAFTALSQGFGAVLLAAFFSPLVVAAAGGRVPSVKRALSQFFSSVGRLLGVSLIFVLAFAIIQLPTLFINELLVGLWNLISYIAIVPLSLLASVSGVVAMQEHLSVINSIKRAAQLLKQNFWRVLGASIIIGLIIGMMVFVVFMVAAFAGMIGLGSSQPVLVLFILLLVIAVFTFGASYISAAIQGALASLAYIDGRFRLDGLDLQWMNPTSTDTTPAN